MPLHDLRRLPWSTLSPELISAKSRSAELSKWAVFSPVRAVGARSQLQLSCASSPARRNSVATSRTCPIGRPPALSLLRHFTMAQTPGSIGIANLPNQVSVLRAYDELQSFFGLVQQPSETDD